MDSKEHEGRRHKTNGFPPILHLLERLYEADRKRKLRNATLRIHTITPSVPGVFP